MRITAGKSSACYTFSLNTAVQTIQRVSGCFAQHTKSS